MRRVLVERYGSEGLAPLPTEHCPERLGQFDCAACVSGSGDGVCWAYNGMFGKMVVLCSAHGPKEKGAEFDTDRFDPPVLLCPDCGGNNLHQTAVEVTHYRSRECGVSGVSVAVYDRGQTTTEVVEGEFDPRNHTRMSFFCENGCDVPDLMIYNHKGLTQLSWDLSDAPRVSDGDPKPMHDEEDDE